MNPATMTTLSVKWQKKSKQHADEVAAIVQSMTGDGAESTPENCRASMTNGEEYVTYRKMG
jgi:hypothetical protein